MLILNASTKTLLPSCCKRHVLPPDSRLKCDELSQAELVPLAPHEIGQVGLRSVSVFILTLVTTLPHIRFAMQMQYCQNSEIVGEVLA